MMTRRKVISIALALLVAAAAAPQLAAAQSGGCCAPVTCNEGPVVLKLPCFIPCPTPCGDIVCETETKEVPVFSSDCETVCYPRPTRCLDSLRFIGALFSHRGETGCDPCAPECGPCDPACCELSCEPTGPSFICGKPWTKKKLLVRDIKCERTVLKCEPCVTTTCGGCGVVEAEAQAAEPRVEQRKNKKAQDKKRTTSLPPAPMPRESAMQTPPSPLMK